MVTAESPATILTIYGFKYTNKHIYRSDTEENMYITNSLYLF